MFYWLSRCTSALSFDYRRLCTVIRLSLYNHNWLSAQSSLVLRDVQVGRVTEVSERICAPICIVSAALRFDGAELRNDADKYLYSAYSSM